MGGGGVGGQQGKGSGRRGIKERARASGSAATASRRAEKGSSGVLEVVEMRARPMPSGPAASPPMLPARVKSGASMTIRDRRLRGGR